MHVGYTGGFQNPGNRETDATVYEDELRLADLAVDLGFDSLWTVEHHFTDYFLSPDPVQYLTWMGARHPHVRLGTGVIVLPWHEPVRCAEQIAMLDNLSGGRLILGLGRGLGRIEYEGFRVPMERSRERFIAYTEMILNGLETGVLEADNEFIVQPRVEIRPRPIYSMRGRVYAAAMSPEAMPIIAKLGIGLMIVPQKPWPLVAQELDAYRLTWHDEYGADSEPPAPLCAGNIVVDADATRVEELSHRYIGAYYETVIAHYGFAEGAHKGLRGYEFYADITKYIDKRGSDGAVSDYVKLMPWGTPDQVIEKLQTLHSRLGLAAFNPSFNFAGMTPSAAEQSLKLFGAEVLPEVQRWEAPVIPLGVARQPTRVVT
jgi:alkanesulfonate monooxygenase SsuD/methylene tetrahydromethanopterin reductase-like flavin-dependent oxidoreductase (luciferase family)